MKISCQSCGAKYNIADDKVRGKIVKIACKKCGARIEIDGREPEAQAHDQDETRVFDQAGQPGGGADSWTVSIDDNDQRELNTAQLMDLIRQGTVTADTFVWRDGMADWQAVRDVAELQSAFGGASGAPAAPAYPSEPPTAVHPAAYDAPPAAPAGFNGGGGYGAPQIEASQPARLGGSRRGGAVDLFAAQPAGHEDEDVATSAPPGGALAAMAGPGAGAGGKPIGARNENSVLFSLSALTASGPANAAPATASGDEEKSGLIDIQKLAAAAKPGNGARDDRAKLDDIMNLGGGGAFGSALGAPILAPPPAAALEVGASGGGEEKKSNKGLILAMGGVVALLLVAVIVLLVTRKGGEEVATKDKDKGALDTPKADEKKDKPKDEGTAAAPPPTETAPAGDPTGGPIGKPGSKPTTGGATTAKPGTTGTAAAPTTTATEKPTTTSPASKCTTLDCAMGNPGGTPPPPPKPAEPAGGGAEFDKGAAKASLSAIPYKDCGSGGAGKVTVTFSPSGKASGASVSGDYDGATKSCVSKRFMGAKVPAFSGDPKSVGWGISL